jgi:hypothetical protein
LNLLPDFCNSPIDTADNINQNLEYMFDKHYPQFSFVAATTADNRRGRKSALAGTEDAKVLGNPL